MNNELFCGESLIRTKFTDENCGISSHEISTYIYIYVNEIVASREHGWIDLTQKWVN